MFTDLSVVTVVVMSPQWLVCGVDRYPFSVPNAPKAGERLIAQDTIDKYGTHIEFRPLLGHSSQS